MFVFVSHLRLHKQELVTYQDVWVEILVIKTTIISQEENDPTHDLKCPNLLINWLWI